MTTACVSLQNVSCVFRTRDKAVHAVSEVSLEVARGEFFSLLGPSGSGKTTCLRMIGGFTLPTAGSIAIEGRDVSRLPPYARPVNTVFQDYALFPHLTVRENVEYPLMVRRVGAADRAAKARRFLDLVQLPQVADRKPSQLSGGQRQRVALARALISEPPLLLLDEPLGALDLKLREQMQMELKSLQRQLGITFIFVTHDQHEALSMSDRIGVFNAGRIEQTGTAEAIYDRPQSRFVAGFVGAANILDGDTARRLTGLPCAMLRPERLRLLPPGADGLAARLVHRQYFGAFSRLTLDVDGAQLQVDVPPESARLLVPAQPLVVGWDADAVHPLRD